MSITGQFRDCLSRQVTKMANISRYQGAVLMNSRNKMAGIRVDIHQKRRWGAQ